MISHLSKIVKAVFSLLGRCKEQLQKNYYNFLDDKRLSEGEICHYKRRIAFVNIVSMFRQDPTQFSIFAGLDNHQINQLSPYLIECVFSKDHMIFEQGQPAEYLYILLGGQVLVRYKPYDGPLLDVAHIEPGGVFGWSAALRRDVYTSGAMAVQESLAYRIRGANLPVICEKYPETGNLFRDRLASVIAERLRSTHTQVLGMLSQRMDPDYVKRSSKK